MTDKKLVETCLERVNDGFKLVVLAAYRAQELSAGLVPIVSRDSSKDTIVSLREIASGKLDLKALNERMVVGMQQFSFLNAPTPDQDGIDNS